MCVRSEWPDQSAYHCYSDVLFQQVIMPNTVLAASPVAATTVSRGCFVLNVLQGCWVDCVGFHEWATTNGCRFYSARFSEPLVFYAFPPGLEAGLQTATNRSAGKAHGSDEEDEADAESSGSSTAANELLLKGGSWWRRRATLHYPYYLRLTIRSPLPHIPLVSLRLFEPHSRQQPHRSAWLLLPLWQVFEGR